MTVKDASVVLFPIHYNDLSSKNKCCYHICSVYCNAACSVLVLRQWGKARSRRAEWHKEQHYSLHYSLHHSHILCNLSLLSPNCVRLQIIKCPCLSKPPWELNRGNTCTVPPLPPLLPGLPAPHLFCIHFGRSFLAQSRHGCRFLFILKKIMGK